MVGFNVANCVERLCDEGPHSGHFVWWDEPPLGEDCKNLNPLQTVIVIGTGKGQPIERGLFPTGTKGHFHRPYIPPRREAPQ